MTRSRTNRTRPTRLATDVLLEFPGGRANGSDELVRAVRQAIRDGRLLPGSRLPPSRELASSLLVARSTVTRAYALLVAEGLLEARTGSGTRVRDDVRPAGSAGRDPRGPQPWRPSDLNLIPGLPDLRGFPRRAWLKALDEALASAEFWDLGYSPPGGHEPARAVLLDYLTRVRGARTTLDDLVLTTGTRAGAFVIATALRRAGRHVVAVEDPGWDSLRSSLSAAGLSVVGVPMDDEGLRVPELAGRRDVAAVVVTPAHHYPLGNPMSPARRRALIEWARERDTWVIEDDYDAEFRYDGKPLRCLQADAPDRVFLVGTVSKTLSPAVGIGWIASPPAWTGTMRYLFGTGHEPPQVSQLAWARFVGEGGYDRHVHRARRRYRARRAALIEALAQQLPGCPVSGTAAGLHLVLHLPGGSGGSTEVVRRAGALGLTLIDPAHLHVGQAPDEREPDRFAGPDDEGPDGAGPPPGAPYLVLGYGNCRDSDIPEAVRRLARAIS